MFEIVMMAAGLPPTPVCTPHVVNRYPHDMSAFTQGLVSVPSSYLPSDFYESTGLYGHSSLRRVSRSTGQVLQEKRLPAEMFAEGVTVWNDTLIQITWRDGVAIKYRASDLQEIGRVKLPIKEGWGITTLNNQFVLSDGSNNLYFVDPNTFNIQRTLQVFDYSKPINHLNELEAVNGRILANVWQTNKIVDIDVTTGLVRFWLDLTSLAQEVIQDDLDIDNVLNGIAYNPHLNTLFVTGKRWESLFEVSFVCTNIKMLIK